MAKNRQGLLVVGKEQTGLLGVGKEHTGLLAVGKEHHYRVRLLAKSTIRVRAVGKEHRSETRSWEKAQRANYTHRTGAITSYIKRCT